MKFSEYQKLAMRTYNPEHPHPYNLANLGLGVAGEAGEVAELIKKFVFHGHALDAGKVKKEIGDVIWYLGVLCDKLGLSFEKVAEENIDKLRQRYPEGFDTERSIRRSPEDS